MSPQTRAAVWWWPYRRPQSASAKQQQKTFGTTQHVAPSPHYLPICEWIDKLRSCSPYHHQTSYSNTPCSISFNGQSQQQQHQQSLEGGIGQLRLVPVHRVVLPDFRARSRRPFAPMHKATCPHLEETAGGLAASVRSTSTGCRAQYIPVLVVWRVDSATTSSASADREEKAQLACS